MSYHSEKCYFRFYVAEFFCVYDEYDKKKLEKLFCDKEYFGKYFWQWRLSCVPALHWM